MKVVFLLLALPIGTQETQLFYYVDLANRCLCVEREFILRECTVEVLVRRGHSGRNAESANGAAAH